MSKFSIEKMSTEYKSTGKDQLTLCIPRVFSNITEKRIRHIFYQLKLGFITKIDMVMSKTPKGENIYKVFIHFKHFFDNENAQRALQNLKAGKEIKVIYDDPWFWKVYEYKKIKGQPKQTIKKDELVIPRIDYFDNDSSVHSSTSTDVNDISSTNLLIVEDNNNNNNNNNNNYNENQNYISDAPIIDYGKYQLPKKKCRN